MFLIHLFLLHDHDLGTSVAVGSFEGHQTISLVDDKHLVF